MKNIFTIDADTPFLDALAREIWRQAGGDGFALSRYLILLPTRRACRHLGAVFAKLADGKPVLLPRMRPLGESDEDEITFKSADDFDLPPAIGSLKRLMLLTRQVQRRDPSLSWDQAAAAADALTRFLDQVQIEQCDMSKLPELVEEQELAEHWQQVIRFLDIVTQNWPLILQEQNSLDPQERRNAVLKAQADLWRRQPPDFPVIAAGSTGSVPATAALLDVIASLPNGSVVLPGLDRAIDNEAWDEVDDTHPQHSMKNLLGKMGVRREAVKVFGPAREAGTRVKLLGEAMRPAAVADAWRALRGTIGADGVTGLSRVNAAHPQEEAQIIALRLRALLEEPEKTASFITADRHLAARVAALLRRWGIEVDDSGGTMLALLPLGSFLTLTLDAARPQAGAVDFLALLKHPFTACGMPQAECRTQAREAEIRARNLETEDFSGLRQILKNLTQNWRRALPLHEHIAAHIAVAEALAATDTETGAERLWRFDTGEETASWLDEWRVSGEAFPAITGEDYTALFAALSSTKTMRPVRAAHPRLSILGPLEARLIDGDLVILGGLNEGSWPPEAGFDPWMSRPMRKKFKLPSPEFRIGLSAHDFATLACGREVMLTRSTRSGGAPTVPSRFLLQIDAVLRAAGLSNGQDALAPARPWQQWAQQLDRPDLIKAQPRPQPRPPVETRPARLSVTEIGTWLRNPYAIYARHILKLEKLEELDAPLDASDRGVMIHRALEKFLKTYPQDLPHDAEAKLLEIGRGIFAQDHGNPRVRAFWWARFIDIAGWFVANEGTRRAAGFYPASVEAKGQIAIAGLNLIGRADRIDRDPDNNLSIIDYKTGGVPTKSEVESGIEPQLPLLALIAQKNGFADIKKSAASSLAYWVLKGGGSGCTIIAFDKNLDALTTAAETGLETLVALFNDPATAYEAAPRARLQPRHNDYAHLSRLAEWGRFGEDP